jgi:flagellar biosynthetic protein FlhB
MAEDRDDTERSEDPTHKRLEEALQRGDVVKSQEVNTWFVLAGGTLVMLTFSGAMGSQLTTTMRGLIANAHAVAFDGRGLIVFFQKLGNEVLATLAIPLLLIALAAMAGNLIQHRLVWSAEALKPKLMRISLYTGTKRLFSRQALVGFLKGLAKLALVGAIMTALLWPQRNRLETLTGAEPGVVLMTVKSLTFEVLGAVVAVLAIIAALDYLFQYRQWFERQKMSVREMKEEFRQTEGDPIVRAKIRQIRQNRMRKRMISAVPQASVVITNPTHYSVALKYDGGMNAPVCVAKGVDAVALRIREVAKEHSVPIVENPPLARTLHAAVKLDQEIPPQHYQAVAEVISYVMRLRRAAAGWRR